MAEYNKYMERALGLALKCKEEPRVGVVIARDNTTLATAYRGEMRGNPDPVYIAIHKAKEHDVDLGYSTLFITHLQDVASVGYIINAGIGRVIIGVKNPENDDVIAELRRSGVNFGVGVLEERINTSIPGTSCPK